MKPDTAANNYIKYVFWLALLFLLIAFLSYVIPRAHLPITTTPSYWGAFGDYLAGILNPLFGILTLIGLAISITLQQDILKVQKDELVATRDELAKSAEALEIQNKTMFSQNFEGTFFRMLEKQSELLYLIGLISSTPETGPKAVEEILRRIKKHVESGHDFISGYETIYQRNNATMGPYFRNLYHTLKLIDQNPHLSEKEKIDYSSLARAQLSSNEISLIFYNCLSEHGIGLKPLIIKYRFLKHIDRNQLANPEWIQDSTLYPPETYLARG